MKWLYYVCGTTNRSRVSVNRMHITNCCFRYFDFTQASFYKPRTPFFLVENACNGARLDTRTLSVDLGYKFVFLQAIYSPPPVYLLLLTSESTKLANILAGLNSALVSSADLRHVCGWNAADDDVLSSPSTAGPKNLEPYDRAWPPLLSDLSQPSLSFTSHPSFFPSLPPSHSNFQFHPQIELLSFFLTRPMSQHVISSSFLVTRGKGQLFDLQRPFPHLTALSQLQMTMPRGEQLPLQ